MKFRSPNDSKVCLTNLGGLTMFKKILFSLTFFAIIFIISLAAKQDTSSVPYPENYRAWTHIKTLVILPGHPLFSSFGGIHHIYANDKALKALKSNSKTFPDGSIFVFDLMEAPQKDNTISEGERKVLAVMIKNSKMFPKTGGWGFEAFKGNSKDRVVKDPVSECYTCHTQKKDRDFVYSEFRK